MDKYPPDRVGFPDTILPGRNEPLIELASDLPQGQPAGPVLSHHSDRGLLGAVFHEPLVEAIEAVGHAASSLVPGPVPRDAEPVKSFKHSRMPRASQTRDLPGE